MTNAALQHLVGRYRGQPQAPVAPALYYYEIQLEQAISDSYMSFMRARHPNDYIHRVCVWTTR